jgi:hypothetical protein
MTRAFSLWRLSQSAARVPALARELHHVRTLRVLAVLTAIFGVLANGTHTSVMSTSVIVVCHLISPLNVNFVVDRNKLQDQQQWLQYK